jgi:aspartate racemase
MNHFLGVLGGMGPLATADFLGKLVENTPADTDQGHIPVLLYGDCTIPDRTASIVGEGPSPLPKLLDGIRFLNTSGVGAICIPCNSAHCWYEDMAAASAVPVFHIVKASAEQVRKKNPDTRTVGVLSTFGTHRMGIYRNTLLDMGFSVVTPTDEEFQSLVSPAIALIKANKLPEAEVVFAKAAARLVARGAEIIILGCTEIPIGMRNQYRKNPSLFVDSNDALAIAVAEFFDSK